MFNLLKVCLKKPHGKYGSVSINGQDNCSGLDLHVQFTCSCAIERTLLPTAKLCDVFDWKALLIKVSDLTLRA